ncbi:MAG: methyltransferase [Alphaproteobacteria bacterium]|nr:methyltransferase [Alphaproteobacteria bacterium]
MSDDNAVLERTPGISIDGLPARTFISRNTAVVAPRLVPEIQLHLAAEARPLYSAGEDELAAMGIGAPYWAFAWSGGQALARYVLDRPETLAGRRVLDFGAGSGLVAIAAALAGAAAVTAADIDPVAVEAMALNRSLNDVDFEIETADLIGAAGNWDVLLVGDVCYDKHLADRLIPWLRNESTRGCDVLIGDPGRFILRGLGLETVAAFHAETTGIMEDSDLRNARVWRFAR